MSDEVSRKLEREVPSVPAAVIIETVPDVHHVLPIPATIVEEKPVITESNNNNNIPQAPPYIERKKSQFELNRAPVVKKRTVHMVSRDKNLLEILKDKVLQRRNSIAGMRGKSIHFLRF